MRIERISGARCTVNCLVARDLTPQFEHLYLFGPSSTSFLVKFWKAPSMDAVFLISSEMSRNAS